MTMRAHLKPLVTKVARSFGLHISPLREYIDGFNGGLLTALLAEVRVVVDVGANIGQSIARVRAELPETNIYAFEPGEGAFAVLRRKWGSDPRVFLSDLALSDHDGTTTFVDCEKSNLSHIGKPEADQRERTIRCSTLDSWANSNQITRIDLLKVDTEGHDLSVIRGARQLFARQAIGCVILEFGGFGQLNSLDADIQAMSGLGFVLGFTFDAVSHDGRPHNGNAFFVRRDLAPNLRI